ncbi:MAG: PH domain-containing protein [Candidatus Nanopelagicales bacterium]|nr:PH domain-containing protein [Candidatus Nanopelagicales bacterium]MDZ4249723.1 PH domain-containing protein [Candidatus Nanopelagicales bacterium]
MELGVDDAFAPPEEPWVKVSPKLTTARRLVLVMTVVPLTAAVVVTAILVHWLWLVWTSAAVAIVVFVWLWWLIGRRVRSFGYVEREDDLLVTSGILFRRLVIVPYGRMQLVDLVAGPIDRSMGLVKVQLHTAAATTDAAIPGLPPEAAAAVRDRLASRGEARSAGL